MQEHLLSDFYDGYEIKGHPKALIPILFPKCCVRNFEPGSDTVYITYFYTNGLKVSS